MNLCYYHSLNYQLSEITLCSIYYVYDPQKLLEIINEI